MSQYNSGRKVGSKGKIEIHAGLKEFFKYYKNSYKNNVNYSTYAKVIKELNKEVSKAIIYEGFELKLPGRLGYLSIIKKKHKLRTNEEGKVDTRFLPVDYQATKELWARMYPNKTEEEIKQIPDRKRVFLRNTHSSGYIYGWFYNKFTCNAKNKSVYYFKASRTNTRELAKYVKSDDFQDHYFAY